jgi:hypothetical protein
VNEATRNLLAAAGLTGAAAISPAILQQISKSYRKKTKQTPGIRTQNITPETIQAYEQVSGLAAPQNIQYNPDTQQTGTYYPEKDRIVLGPEATQFTLAHELGHHQIQQAGGPLNFAQKYLYHPPGENLSPLVTGAIGALVPSNRHAAALALATTYLMNAGKLASEYGATQNAIKTLEAAGVPIPSGITASQLGTYAVGPATQSLIPLAAGRILRTAFM